MDHDPMPERFEAIRAEAERRAGDLLDIPRRAAVLRGMYRDSGGNHQFALLAAHGALWGFGYFETGGALGRFIGNRYFYNKREKAYRLGLLDEFAAAFRKINRQVCIDSLTNYAFVGEFGDQAGVERFVAPSLVEALGRVHAAKRAGTRLTPAEARGVFEASFHCEQEVTVAPGVAAAIAGFECRIMQFLCLHPIVRFSYFPQMTYLLFHNFANTSERIAKGMRAFELAAAAGWERAEEALGQYGVPLADSVG